MRTHFDLVVMHDPSEVTEKMLKDVSVVFAPLGYSFDEAFFRKAPKLRIIATNTTGTPHIDVKQANARGIRVVSLHEETEFLKKITPTAELTIGLMIALTRNILPAVKFVLDGGWGRWNFAGVSMLSRMSLGIVGFGRLGKMVAKYARAFGMKVSFYDPYLENEEEGPYARVESLKDLVRQNDIVSVHCSLHEKNQHMFSRDVFFSFKKGSFFINTARGELVDSTALIDALEAGILKGAAVDVLEGEFDPKFPEKVMEHPLVRYARKNQSLIITPHIGGSTYDAWYMTQRHTILRTIDMIKRIKHEIES